MGKRMHGQFIREMPVKVDKEKTRNWMVRNDLTVRNEVLSSATYTGRGNQKKLCKARI